MKDIIKEVLGKVELGSTVKTVTDKGLEKLAASAIKRWILEPIGPLSFPWENTTSLNFIVVSCFIGF